MAVRSDTLAHLTDICTRLRRKVDAPFEVKLLQTIRGVGFALREEKG